MGKQRRRYSDEERANALVALAANGGNVEHTAEQLGIPKTTLHNWATGQRHPEASQMGTEKKPALADAMEEVLRLLVGDMPKKIDDANLKDAAVAAGILTEKIQLLRGQATSISGTAGTPEERARRLKELEDRVRRRALAADDPRGTGGTGPDPDPTRLGTANGTANGSLRKHG